ncbi:MAG: alpha/beta fold hydrolase [Nitrospinae bacterium]|nr:alpha/beta fold hydrolase [Nitrospinota bacterium]
MLMLHGNPTWSYYYRNVVKKFSSSYRCVVPDHIGCGNSDKPQNYAYQLRNHIDNLCFLVDFLKLENITLIVHDWGGAIGMGFAVRNPEKIKRIVILNTAAFLINRIPFRINICKLPFFGDIAIRGFNAFAKSALFMAVKKPLSPEVQAQYIKPYNNWKNRIATLRFVQDIPMTPSHPTWNTLKEIEEKLPLLNSTPKLICWGMKDFCFNDIFLKRWETIYPEAEIHRFENAGHYVLEDAQEEINSFIDLFIKKT